MKFHFEILSNSSVIKQKGESLKRGVSRKQSMPKFPKNKHFLPPDTHVSVGKKCLFFGNFCMLCFLETPVLRFALLPYYRQIKNTDGKYCPFTFKVRQTYPADISILQPLLLDQYFSQEVFSKLYI